ncbi:hypothetical protein GJAV_G00183680 [Gymnothorax javanicus]|nr:hypothetical protein GJAV_G00183680 [Gymnothorax javanicus]
MGKGIRSSGLPCILAVLLTAFVRVGFSEEYQARVGPQNSLYLQRVKRQSRPVRAELKVTDFHVRCRVVSRYAATTVQSSVWNTLPVTKEAAFEVDLPSSAFISNFSIISNGKEYVAQVQERSAAKKIYDAAKKKGKTAGLVATKEREVERFRVAVSVPSGARLSFSLTYEELLSRRLGRYELVLGLRPGQPIQNLTLEASVMERSGIRFIRALPLRTNRLLTNAVSGEAEAPPSTQVVRTPHCAQVRYTPTLQQQTGFSSKGLNADFVIQYDVELKDLMGDVQIYDGYFVHYFAPRGLPVVPKDVIFVIDISGSMTGTKIKQTKQAMNTILSDLREGDHFNIITFSDKVHTWKKGGTVQATRQNIGEAKEFVKKINADGWTNINSALLTAAQLVSPSSPHAGQQGSGVKRVPLVIFLTDGEATTGVTSSENILRNARKALDGASLFGLAFGDDADLPLLRRLALENRGVARTVYEDADAVLQLKGFYDEVASPLLSDIQLSYLDDQAFDVTQALFPNYFEGSELVVTGRVKPGIRDLKVSLTAADATHRLRLENDVSTSRPQRNDTAESLTCPGGTDAISSFVRRLWAYYTIKELLQAKLNTTDGPTQRLLAEKATNLSLKYNFVTPVSSLVVVKPDADEVTPNTTTTPTPTTTTTTAATAITTTAPPIRAPPSIAKTASPKTTNGKKLGSGIRTGKSKPDRPPNTKLPPPSGIHTTGRPLSPPPPRELPTAPSPGKTAAPLQPKKSTTPEPTAFKTSPSPVSAPRPALSKQCLLAEKRPPFTPVLLELPPHPQLGSPRPSSSLPESGTAPPVDIQHPDHTTVVLSAPASSTALPDDDPTTSEVATLIAATFVPMPRATEVPKLWEAAGMLDVSTVVKVSEKDMDPDTDYDDYDYFYDHGYDRPSQAGEYDLELIVGDTDDYGQGVLFDAGRHSTSSRVFSGSVDGDPHFVVKIPRSDKHLCFTVDGRANDVLSLLEDQEKGILVIGHLAYAPSKHGFEDRSRTYFDQLTISVSAGGGVTIRVTMDSVVLEGEGRETLRTDRPGLVKRQGLSVTLDDHLRCWVELGRGQRFLILFHHYKHPTYLQIAHLGFYIADGQGLSPRAQGLLGQFQHADMEVTRTKGHSASSHLPAQDTAVGHLAEGVLRKGAVTIPVSMEMKHLKDTVRRGHQARCWVVPRKQVETLLGRPYETYVVDHV